MERKNNIIRLIIYEVLILLSDSSEIINDQQILVDIDKKLNEVLKYFPEGLEDNPHEIVSVAEYIKKICSAIDVNLDDDEKETIKESVESDLYHLGIFRYLKIS